MSLLHYGLVRFTCYTCPKAPRTVERGKNRRTGVFPLSPAPAAHFFFFYLAVKKTRLSALFLHTLLPQRSHQLRRACTPQAAHGVRPLAPDLPPRPRGGEEASLPQGNGALPPGCAPPRVCTAPGRPTQQQQQQPHPLPLWQTAGYQITAIPRRFSTSCAGYGCAAGPSLATSTRAPRTSTARR